MNQRTYAGNSDPIVPADFGARSVADGPASTPSGPAREGRMIMTADGILRRNAERHFNRWLFAQAGRHGDPRLLLGDSLVGDLARDAARDRGWPRPEIPRLG